MVEDLCYFLFANVANSNIRLGFYTAGHALLIQLWWQYLLILSNMLLPTVMCGLIEHIDGLVQDCSNSSALAMEII